MIDGIHEVILYVKDMNTQSAFYRELLQLAVTYKSEDWTTFDTGTCTLALHSGGNADSKKDIPKIVFKVSDIQTAREHLLSNEIPVSDIRCPAPNIQVVDFKNPEGNNLSLEQI